MASFLSWFGVVFLTPTLPEVGGHFKFQLNLGHPRDPSDQSAKAPDSPASFVRASRCKLDIPPNSGGHRTRQVVAVEGQHLLGRQVAESRKDRAGKDESSCQATAGLSWERPAAIGGWHAGGEDPPVVADRVIARAPAAETGRNRFGRWRFRSRN